jgi:two-component system sensor histidine kinase EvgS
MQQEGQNTRKYGGTGLGLTITKRLTEMMNGKIFLESQQGRGSSFVIIFNDVFSTDIAAKDSIRKTDILNIDFLGATILIADDSSSNREVLKGFLKNSNIIVAEAENGQKVLQLSEVKHPDLILMDMHMPVMDGNEAVVKIRESVALMNIPVISLTATLISEIDNNILNLYNGHLLKPISKNQLVNELMKFLPYANIDSNMPEKIGVVDSNVYLAESLTSELIDKLRNNWLSKIEDLKMSMFIDEIELFAADLMHLAEEYKSDRLMDYSNKLYLDCESLNFDNINSLLNEFINMING